MLTQGWNEWQEVLNTPSKEEQAPKKGPAPKPPNKLTELTGWEYMQRVNRQSRGHI